MNSNSFCPSSLKNNAVSYDDMNIGFYQEGFIPTPLSNEHIALNSDFNILSSWKDT